MRTMIALAVALTAAGFAVSGATAATTNHLRHHARAAFNQMPTPPTIVGTDPGGLGPRQVCVDPDPNICSEVVRFYGRNSAGN